MKKSIAQILLYTAFSVLIMPSWAETAEAEATSISLSYPATTDPLVVNSNPFDIEAGPLEKIYVKAS